MSAATYLLQAAGKIYTKHFFSFILDKVFDIKSFKKQMKSTKNQRNKG